MSGIMFIAFGGKRDFQKKSKSGCMQMIFPSSAQVHDFSRNWAELISIYEDLLQTCTSCTV